MKMPKNTCICISGIRLWWGIYKKMDKILMTKIFTKYEPIPNTRVNDKNYHKNPPKPKSPDPRPQATSLITHPGWGIKQLSPVFSPPILVFFIPHYSYPPFPTPRFWCGFSLGIFRWEKRDIFLYIFYPPLQLSPIFEKKKLAIFFILSAILQLSPTTIISSPPLLVFSSVSLRGVVILIHNDHKEQQSGCDTASRISRLFPSLPYALTIHHQDVFQLERKTTTTPTEKNACVSAVSSVAPCGF